MVSKRPFKWTTQETASVFWAIGFGVLMVFLWVSYDPYYGIFVVIQPMLLFLGVSVFFFFLAFFYPCYQISRWDCNIFMDKMEPGWSGWLRTTKSRIFAPQCVKTGPLGQMKGLVEGYKADIINRGDFPVRLRNGNHAVFKYDLMSHNINLNECIGWKMMVRKWGFLGTNAFKRCYSEGKTVKKKEETKKKHFWSKKEEEVKP